MLAFVLVELGLQSKTAFVFGASRGLGRRIALGLAAEGARIVAVARSQESLESLLAELPQPQAHRIFAADLNDPSILLGVISELKSENPDILVHNLGGTLGVRDPFCTLEDFRSVLRLNFEIAYELNREFIPFMQKKKWGRVVHISSIASERSRGALPYRVAKATLNAYVDSLGHEVIRDNVILSSLLLGAFLTPQGVWKKRLAENPEKTKNYIESATAVGRFAEHSEIASFVLFLCSERHTLSAGSSYVYDGGTF